jgi:hypothetical protein
MQEPALDINAHTKELILAAHSEVQLMSQLLCLKLGLTVKVYDSEGSIYRADRYLKANIIRSSYYKIESQITDISIFEELHKWISDSTNDQEVHRESLVSLNNIKSNFSYRETFINNFDPISEAEKYIEDPLVPRGTVHYRISYSYCYSKNVFITTRSKFGAEKPDWKNDNLWFDYYGQEENELGLLYYLDYV